MRRKDGDCLRRIYIRQSACQNYVVLIKLATYSMLVTQRCLTMEKCQVNNSKQTKASWRSLVVIESVIVN